MRRARTQAREAALKALYQLDLRDDFTGGDVELFLGRQGLTPDAQDFARGLVDGVSAYRDAVDAEIEAVAVNWKLKRMAVVDRNVLRVGVFELMHRPEVPAAVAINEAVQLVKRYSTRESGSFVNGILDHVHRRRRPGEPAPEVAAVDALEEEAEASRTSDVGGDAE